MAKEISAIGGIIIILTTLVSVYIPFMGLYYYSNTLLFPAQAWFDIFGVYHWTWGNIFGAQDAMNAVQILGYIILGGGIVILIGGIASSKILAGIGVAVTVVGLIIFAIMLQGILDSSGYYPAEFNPYDGTYSIFFTINQDLLIFGPLTQMLGGSFWSGILGIVLGLTGISSMKK